METNRVGSADVLMFFDTGEERSKSEALMKKHSITSYTLIPLIQRDRFFQESHWRGKVVVALHTSSMTSMELAVTPYRELKQYCDKVGAAFRVLALGVGAHGDFFDGILKGCSYNENEFNQLLNKKNVQRNSVISLVPGRVKRWFAPVCCVVIAVVAVIFAAHRLYSSLV